MSYRYRDKRTREICEFQIDRGREGGLIFTGRISRIIGIIGERERKTMEVKDKKVDKSRYVQETASYLIIRNIKR